MTPMSYSQIAALAVLLLATLAQLFPAVARPQAAVPTPPASARAAAVSPHATAAFGDAGRKAGVQPVDADLIARVNRLIDLKDGPGLFKEFEKLLLAGQTGYAGLANLCFALDQDSHRVGYLTTQYQITFSLMHLSMLREVELAEFAHYFLAASAATPRSVLRAKLYDMLPDFLKFHAGRFPDLEDALKRDIEVQLTQDAIDESKVYAAAKTLDFRPPLALVERHLFNSTGLGLTQLVADHLAWRDDEEALRLIDRFLATKPATPAIQKATIFRALVKMQVAQAERVLNRYVYSDDPQTMFQAALVYFSVPREERTVRAAIRLLNSSRLDLKSKRAFIAMLKKSNVDILDFLVAARDQVIAPEVRELVQP
jgi:hypothetical protein